MVEEMNCHCPTCGTKTDVPQHTHGEAMSAELWGLIDRWRAGGATAKAMAAAIGVTTKRLQRLIELRDHQ